MEKVCKKCNENKPATEFYNYYDRLHAWCKKCCIAWQKKYYREHRDERLAYTKKYSKNYLTVEEQRAYQKAYREKNREKIKAYLKEYYRKTKQTRSARRRICPVCAHRAKVDSELKRALEQPSEAHNSDQKNNQNDIQQKA
jgi:hypothetical protein